MKTEALEESYKRIGALYPVLVDKKGKIIDGKHRKKVDPNWKEEVIDVENEKDRLLIEFAANITRREIPREEITKLLDNLAKETGWNSTRIANEIGRSESFVQQNISQKYKNSSKAEAGKKGGEIKAAIYNMAEEEEEQFIDETNIEEPLEKEAFTEEIGKNDGEPLEFDSDIVTEEEEGVISKTKEICNGDLEEESYLLNYLDNEEFISNVWISDGVRGKGKYIYGDPTFHGNTPPVIGFLSLMKYTKEGDIVLDPMAGSGTLIDICNGFNRKIKAFDIKPMRDDISFANTVNIPLEKESVDFIFSHFPYWNMVEYSDNKEDLSNMKLTEFLDKIKTIFLEFSRVLKKERYCAILIGDKRKNGLIDLSAHVSLIGSDYLKLHDKVIWVADKQRSVKGVQSNLSKWRAEKHGYHLQRFDTLLIFKKIDK